MRDEIQCESLTVGLSLGSSSGVEGEAPFEVVILQKQAGPEAQMQEEARGHSKLLREVLLESWVVAISGGRVTQSVPRHGRHLRSHGQAPAGNMKHVSEFCPLLQYPLSPIASSDGR